MSVRLPRFFAGMGIAWLVIISSWALPWATAERVILFEDFEDDIPDSLPNTADGYARSTSNPGDPSKAAVSGGEFTDPFGGGNQSLVLHNPLGTTQMAVIWINEFLDDPSTFRNGRIEFDLYMEKPDPAAFWTYLDLRIGHGDASRTAIGAAGGDDITIWNSIRLQNLEGFAEPLEQIADDGNRFVTGAIPVYNDHNSPDDLFGPDRAFHVRYDFDGSGTSFQDPPTFTLTVTDTTVLWGDQETIHPWIVNPATFEFAPGINILGFWTDASANSNGTGNVYIDNLRIVNADLPPLLRADLNGDGSVDASDAGVVFAAWGTDNDTADLNVDNFVDAADAGIMFAEWTGDAAGAQSVPEPTFPMGAYLCGLACLATGCRAMIRSST